jgi:uncharacterized protein
MGRVIHFDIPIDDPDRASAFYREAFGLSVEQWGEFPYWTLSGGADEAGANGALTPRDQSPDSTVVYFEVPDIDAALEQVEAAGGTLETEKMPIPTVGWSAHVRDSEGNLIGVFQSDPSVEMPAGGPV